MTVIIALDDKDGYTLFGKRLSRDREMISDMINSFDKIAVSDYSRELFENGGNLIPLPSQIPDNMVLFLETEDIPEKANTLIVYRWNRHYPSNKRYSPKANGWRKKEESFLTGYSHSKITKEIYTK